MKDKNLTYYDTKEERLNVISHALGLVLSIIALVLLLLESRTSALKSVISFAIYGTSLIVLYAASTFYHSSQEPELRRRLNVLDHASIYVLIAGTYTPFTLIILKGWVGWTIFGISWGLALLGIILKIFYIGKFGKLSTAAYITMGWLIIFAIKPLIASLSLGGLMWLFGGGLSYTIGAVLYSIPKLKYNHAIFHVFVLCGSFCHFMAVYYHVLK